MTTPDTVQEVEAGRLHFTSNGHTEVVDIRAFSNRVNNPAVLQALFGKTGHLYSKNIKTGLVRWSGGNHIEGERPLTLQDFCESFGLSEKVKTCK